MAKRIFSPVLSLVVGLSVCLISGNLSNAQEPMNQSPTETTQKNNKKAKPQTPTESAPATTETVADPPVVKTTQDTVKVPQPVASAANLHSEPTDLSGSYAGTFKCDEVGLTGETTLTITGNQFSTSDGKTGRIVASTTQGYTAVALQLGDSTAPGTIPTIISLRARKNGSKLTLLPVAASQVCSFTPSRMVASRRSRTTSDAVVGTPVGNPAEVGPSPEGMSTAPKAKSKKRKVTPAPRVAAPAVVPTETPLVPVPTESPLPEQQPSPSPSPSPSASPRPTPTQNPSPSPSPSPLPSPSPSPNQEPSPSPSPSPLPSPSPSPAPKKPLV